MAESRVRINLTGKAPKEQPQEEKPTEQPPQSRVRINLTGKRR
ncbi:hypothetical protein OG422_31175 (plasmid) [Streptomyces sp. NBC_01525]